MQIQDEVKGFFAANPNEAVYVGTFDVDGDAKILSAAATAGKALGKATYVFGPNVEGGRGAHANFVPRDVLDKKILDAKSWMAEVSAVVGGKVSHQ